MNNKIIVIKVKELVKHPNADRLQLLKVFGTQCIVGLDLKVDDIICYIDSNCVLSESFLSKNNLYRHSEKNEDKSKIGLFDDNGRVRCIKLRGEISDGFIFPLSFLSHWEKSFKNYVEGYEFDTVGKEVICQKYIIKLKNYSGIQAKKVRTTKNVPMFVEHFDTDQFMKSYQMISPQTVCYIEEKIHGTSARLINASVEQKPQSFITKFLRFLGFNRNKWEQIHGTRRVCLSGYDRPSKYVPFHNPTMRDNLYKTVLGKLQKGQQAYFEIYGYEVGGTPIQKGFPYGCREGEHKFMLYRVTMNNEDGHVVDYSREFVYNISEYLGVDRPTLFEKVYYDGSESSMENIKQKVIQYAQGQSSIDPNTLKEGVVVWFINSKGYWTALKYKSDAFRLQESSNKDKGVVDMEDTL